MRFQLYPVASVLPPFLPSDPASQAFSSSILASSLPRIQSWFPRCQLLLLPAGLAPLLRPRLSSPGGLLGSPALPQPSQPPAALLAQSGRSSPDLSASRSGCEFQQLARRRQRLARVYLCRLVSPRLGGRERPGSPWSPSEDNAPGAGPPSRALVRARLLSAAPRRRPATAPLPPGGLLPRPERLGRQQHQHQHQPRGGRRQTRRRRRLPEQQHRRGARGRRREH